MSASNNLPRRPQFQLRNRPSVPPHSLAADRRKKPSLPSGGAFSTHKHLGYPLLSSSPGLEKGHSGLISVMKSVRSDKLSQPTPMFRNAIAVVLLEKQSLSAPSPLCLLVLPFPSQQHLI